ncbi:2OG-Fe dioxygenase family protein [Micromonospora sp. NPDC051141]|uniref:2OG-Fe dioxygenase family protein n=1 Tax=Micromonospora sp. NPDC051141 TaxID=3364284 RepID=UPI0037AAF79A
MDSSHQIDQVRHTTARTPDRTGTAGRDTGGGSGPALGPPCADHLTEHGWAHGRLRASADGPDWRRFASCWDNLVTDRYLGQARCVRRRRYGRLLAHRDGRLEPLHGTEFFQSRAINPVFGDQVRVFEPLTADALACSRFVEVLRESVALVNEVAGARDWELGVHFIRVVGDRDAGSEPAPEGRHSDGHEYVSIHLVGRHRCVGGENRVYRRGAPVAEYATTMTEPLETLVLHDTTTEHAVSEIRSADPHGSGWRDTLIVDFDPVRDPAGPAGRTHRWLN